MKEYFCTHCGYHMKDERIEDTMSGVIGYPFMTSGGGIVPSAGMKYMVIQSEPCPICNSIDSWEEIK